MDVQSQQPSQAKSSLSLYLFASSFFHSAKVVYCLPICLGHYELVGMIPLFSALKGRSSSALALQTYSIAATSTLTPYQMLLWSC
jgi:hypothetical protein